MPTYNFRNKKTGKVKTMTMSIAEAEAYEKANPHMDWLCGAPPQADPWRIGRMKPDSAFRDILKRVKKTYHGSDVNDW